MLGHSHPKVALFHKTSHKLIILCQCIIITQILINQSFSGKGVAQNDSWLLRLTLVNFGSEWFPSGDELKAITAGLGLRPRMVGIVHVHYAPLYMKSVIETFYKLVQTVILYLHIIIILVNLLNTVMKPLNLYNLAGRTNCSV